ncbi:glycosyltransferase [Geobacillus sp. Sah69]|uniref:glycosyltransferase n=1 Tax=Geobacillus TaxID=129337 RepID=UPI0006DCCFD9|nr:glycosyltransferase [Geobacillus sp. Sah69]KQC47979.1 glycosyltransferase [Geobacillus sp. Sah69]
MIPNCDIIIPVYNAVNELKECVDSILKYTDEVNYRIIIINDCSPDPEVKNYLNTLVEHEKILVIENEKNLGFVGTVNVGMRISKNDVVLLNSDTVVTDGWLKKIINAAYMDENIATVTPLTNNGTICSVPNFNEDNEMPHGFSVDSFAQFIEKTSLNLFPEIPTAVGFCMFIKRKVLDEIGLFDEETFGKGYGEENDFCCRVIEHGYRNILADNVFIYHKGSMSFQGEKLKLMKENGKKLNEKYPYYDKMIANFIRENPLKKIHENIQYRMEEYRNETDGNILFIMHNFFDEAYNHSIGGTEFHVKDIIQNIQNYNAYVLSGNMKELILKHFYLGELKTTYHFKLKEPINLTHFRNKYYAEVLEQIMTSFNIDLIHIHHLKQHTFDVPFVAKKLGIKVIFTLHDYYLFCPKTNLLDENYEYCIDSRSEYKCRNCLRKAYGFYTPFINKWKQHVEKLIEQVDLFICPSKSTEELFVREFGQKIKNKITTIEHGIEEIKDNYSKHQRKNRIEQKSSSYKIGFLGGLSPVKGSNVIYEVITSYPKQNVEWHLIGELGDPKLTLLNQVNVIKHGRYKRESIQEILESIGLDLICFFSQCPETYSYTLSEAWRSNIPVLVTPIGALKERVEKNGGGWVAEGMDSKSIMKKLDEIMNSTVEDWEKVKDNIRKFKYRTKKEMMEDYIQLYNKFISEKEKTTLQSNHKKFTNEEVYLAAKYFKPILEGMSVLQYNNKIHELQMELNSIKNTIGWKILDYLRKNYPQFIEVTKRVIYLVLKMRRS